MSDSTEFHTPRFSIVQFEPYTPKDTAQLTKEGFIGSTAMAALATGLKTAVSKSPTAHSSDFYKKHGITFFAITSAGTAYTFASAVAANLREKNDPYNELIGGSVAGFIVGASTKNVTKTFGTAIFLGLAAGLHSWSGGLIGLGKDAAKFQKEFKETVEPENKQGFWEIIQRKPLSQTKADLGDAFK